MAKRKSSVNKNLKKIKKSNPGLYLFIVILLLIVGLGITYFVGGFDSFLPENIKSSTIFKRNANSSNNSGTNNGNTGENGNTSGNDNTGGNGNTEEHNHSEDGVVENVIYPDFQIHFMTLGNADAGDSVYIKAGDTDILVDAGAVSGSYTTTSAYVNKYCKDNKLEYCIATHGDADHISAFPKYFQNYQVDTIIDFTSETYEQFQAFKESGKKARDYFCGTSKTTATYGYYLQARDQHASHHYTAGDCFKNINGAQSVYQLSNNVKMTILYNKYYFEKGYNGSTVPSGWENNYSVCTLFTYTKDGKDHNFLLTGDLELEGEEAMASYYNAAKPETTLPKVDLFKAGHHGSKTSSNTCLLQKIRPAICVVSCCCGTDEYTGATANQFPTQAFIDRIAPYTDRVYVTTIFSSYTIETAQADSKGNSDKTGVAIGGNYIHTSGYKPMNGNVCVSCNGDVVGLWASNNLIKLKDTEWFKSKVTIDGVEINVRNCPSAWK